jgi:hypothetical protein
MRQDLYERFHFGDATLRKVMAYFTYDKTDAIGMVKRVLEKPNANEVWPLPAKTADESETSGK